MQNIRKIFVTVMITLFAVPMTSYLAAVGGKACDVGWYTASGNFDSSIYYSCNGNNPNLGKMSGGFRYKTFGDDELWGDAKQTADSVYYVSSWVKNGEGAVVSSSITPDYAFAKSYAKAGTDYYSMNSYYTK